MSSCGVVHTARHQRIVRLCSVLIAWVAPGCAFTADAQTDRPHIVSAPGTLSGSSNGARVHVRARLRMLHTATLSTVSPPAHVEGHASTLLEPRTGRCLSPSRIGTIHSRRTATGVLRRRGVQRLLGCPHRPVPTSGGLARRQTPTRHAPSRNAASRSGHAVVAPPLPVR